MGNTTALARLEALEPESETEWRVIQGEGYRLIGGPGCDSWGESNKFEANEIRKAQIPGSSRHPRNCPRCRERGENYMLIFMGGMDRCGCCLWPDEREDMRIPGL